jgi:hypothetical protein
MTVKFNEILPRLMIAVTGHGRHKVHNIEWSSDSWTHNAFRVWEMFFWRRLGESNNPGDTISAYASFDWDDEARKVRLHFHCKEAAIAHCETVVRKAFQVAEWKAAYKARDLYRMSQHPLVVQLGFAGFLLTLDSSKVGFMLPLMSGAIALQTGVNGDGSFAITIGGSNRVLFVSQMAVAAGSPSCDLDSVPMTEIDRQTTGAANYRSVLYYLIAPATGAGTVNTNGIGTKGCGAQYTGCAQSGIPDATAKASNSTTSITASTTTIADNCWVYMAGGGEWSNISSLSAGSGSTKRGEASSSGSFFIGAFDNNAAKTPPGSVSMAYSIGGGTSSPGCAYVTASFAPAPTTAIKTWNGLAYASVKTVDGLAVASVKNINGLA